MKQLFFSMVLIALFYQTGLSQNNWRMQPVAVQTRWAKQVTPANALKEYPRPQMVRSNWINLNGLWDYAIFGKEQMTAPVAQGKILVPFPVESALSGAQKKLLPNQVLWYRRNIQVPALQAGERLLLHFGAVDFKARVLVNGKEAGSHTGGYGAFTFDITDLLKKGTNELSVFTEDPTDQGPNPHGKQVLNPAGIMYTPSSGIWQTVWMEKVPAVHIEGLVITPDVDKGVVHVVVKGPGKASVSVLDRGQEIATSTASPRNDGTGATFFLKIPNAKLWSPDDPFLYDLKVTMGRDVVKSYFGMRKIEVKKDQQGTPRIFLNNRYCYNLGTLDQGFWPDGLYTAPTDEALAFDIRAAKALGFNTIRKHIKIEPARWYYHADKLGMLVWQDMVNPGNDSPEGRAQFEQECAEYMAQLHNHPSITTWVLFNEKWGQYDQERLTRWMKQTDPTRLVNGHSGEKLYVNDQLRSPSPNAWAGADMTDVHAYPNPGYIAFDKDKAAVLGEFGGIGVPVEGHLWDDLVAGWGYDGVVGPNKMQKQYTGMTDSLKVLERQGLTASIYTQPFDVESEQNGLLTYDREKLKLPVATIRSIHARLWPATKNVAAATTGFSVAVADTAVTSYAAKLKAYEGGKRDSALLRYMAIAARQQKNKEVSAAAATEYISKLKSPLSPVNLKFVQQFTTHTTDPGFNILYNNINKVNEVLGQDAAESVITAAIERDIVKPMLPKEGKPDWAAIEEKAVLAYGELGRELVWQTKVINSLNHKDTETFAASLGPWYKTYGYKRNWLNAMFLNNVAWAAFEDIDNKEGLEGALMMSEKVVTKLQPGNSNNMDTYANLLYKLGRKEEALEWQKKAIAADPNSTDIKAAYEKMQRGEPTWIKP